jgi:hypothetical protein
MNMKALKCMLMATVALMSSFVVTHQWNHQENHASLLPRFSPLDFHESELEDVWQFHQYTEYFPDLVRAYIDRVLPPEPERAVRSIRLEQQGFFFLKSKWIPFTAMQEFTQSCLQPALIWDATMNVLGSLPPLVSINIRDESADQSKLLGTLNIVSERAFKLLKEEALPDCDWLSNCDLLLPTQTLHQKEASNEIKRFHRDHFEEKHRTAFVIEVVDYSDPNGTLAWIQVEFL